MGRVGRRRCKGGRGGAVRASPVPLAAWVSRACRVWLWTRVALGRWVFSVRVRDVVLEAVCEAACALSWVKPVQYRSRVART